MALILSDKQTDFLTYSDAPYNFCTGAVSGGKTYITNLRWVDYLATEAPAGDLAIIGKTRDTAVRNIIRPIQSLVGDKRAEWRRGSGEFSLFGRVHAVIGANDEKAENKIRGLSLAGALGDEMTLWPRSFWDMLTTRLRVPGARFFGTTNPDNPRHYLKSEVLDCPDAWDYKHWHFLVDDNEFLLRENPDYIARIKRQYHGVFHKRFILGEWALADGLIYGDSFSTAKNVVDMAKVFISRKMKPFRHHFVGVDYAASDKDALTFLLFGTDSLRGDQPVYLLREFYYRADPQNGKPKLSNGQMVDRFNKWLNGVRVRGVFVDPGGGGSAFANDLLLAGYPVKDPTKDVLDGIAVVDDLFFKALLLIDQSCKFTVSELESYIWDPKSLVTKPLKANDHCLDALRYVIYTLFGNVRRGPRYAAF
ncbi:MAG: PBSX family phage terminase large subunit [Pseudodesulfovibrio sp.]|uniref:PBSX family phage terminase large subunit n=1 Tax=Pseudodesulfovibrio sp. TaxID=2035812 RepID=UPI003D143FD6